MPLIFRDTKGAPLTSAEGDANIRRLDAGKDVVDATAPTALTRVFNRLAGYLVAFVIATSGSKRWQFGGTADAEAGSNVGTDFFFDSYADDGITVIGRAISIVRKTLLLTFGGAVNVIGLLTVGTAGINFSDGTNQQTAAAQYNKFRNSRMFSNVRGYVNGTATAAAYQYTFDCWRVVVSGQSVTATATNDSQVVTCPAGGFEQVIDPVDIEGGNYTFGWTGTASAVYWTTNPAATTPLAKNQIIAISAGSAFGVRFSSGSLSKPMMVLGNSLAVGVHRSYAEEQAGLSQYVKRVRIDMAGFNTTANAGLLWIVNYNRMRKTPTGAVVTTPAYAGIVSPPVLTYLADFINISGQSNGGATWFVSNYEVVLSAEL